ncbi:MAG: TetR/AcrR family transcriptional regulator, partial [Halobacteriaceae archaeon]
INDGIEEGHFRDADPERVARFVVTVINGGLSRQVALGEGPEVTRSLVVHHLEEQLGWAPEEDQ